MTVTRVSPLQAIATANVTSSHALSRTAYEVKYMDLFWDLYLPQGRLLSDYYLQHSVGSWTRAARDLYTTEPALQQALLAMSLSSLGHRNGEKDLMEAGLKHYVAALGEISAGLRHRDRRKSDALLIATRTLGLYEVMTRSSLIMPCLRPKCSHACLDALRNRRQRTGGHPGQ